MWCGPKLDSKTHALSTILLIRACPPRSPAWCSRFHAFGNVALFWTWAVLTEVLRLHTGLHHPLPTKTGSDIYTLSGWSPVSRELGICKQGLLVVTVWTTTAGPIHQKSPGVELVHPIWSTSNTVPKINAGERCLNGHLLLASIKLST